MKHKKLWAGCILVLALGIGIVIGRKEMFNDYFSAVKLQYLESYLKSNYLYEVNEQNGLETVYSGYLSGVENAVTYYVKKEDLEAVRAEDEGDYSGTGISMMWNIDGQSFVITKVIPDSPADKQGIKRGDRITSINGTKAIMANSQKLVDEAFSNKKEPVQYMILHDGKEKEVALTPERVKLEPVTSQMMGDVLYIQFASVQTGISEKVETLLKQAESRNCKGVILDIRDLYTNNIEEISKLCDLFLNEGVVFKVETKADKMTEFEMTQGAYNGKVCLITNSSTKAGAEALALGLKDKAKIVGSDTAGLKYLRTLAQLSDGSGVSVASGIIYDQYGNELSEKGIEPDERVYITDQERMEIIKQGYVTTEHDSFIKAALDQIHN